MLWLIAFFVLLLLLLSRSRHTIATHVEIAAQPGAVWRVLTDFDSHPKWNPFIRSISGELREGAKLNVHIAPPGAKGMTFRPTVIRVEPERHFRWLGRVGVPRLFDGEHYFILEPLPSGTVRLTHGETFRGVLVPILASMLKNTEAGFAAMNDALKREVESRT